MLERGAVLGSNIFEVQWWMFFLESSQMFRISGKKIVAVCSRGFTWRIPGHMEDPVSLL